TVLDTMAQIEQKRGNAIEAEEISQRAEKIRAYHRPIAKATK
ncbi:unnamed protein product, partial [marine sediment metagenome]